MLLYVALLVDFFTFEEYSIFQKYMFEGLLLKLFILVNGLGAASGLVYHKNQVYVVADDLPYIYSYNLKNSQQRQYALKTIIPINEMKRSDKLDVESLVYHKNKIYGLGSGSKSNRNEFHVLDLKSKETLRYDLTKLYQEVRTRLEIDEKDFNIEGFQYHKGKSYLFNRGNGKNNLNAIITFEGLPHESDLNELKLIQIKLPEINGYLTTFSDAIILKNKIYYTATIEAESTVQKDGEVKESILGLIDLKTFKVESYQIIAQNQKIEGLTLYKKSCKDLTFLFSEDNDDDSKESKIYQLKVSKDLKEIK